MNNTIILNSFYGSSLIFRAYLYLKKDRGYYLILCYLKGGGCLCERALVTLGGKIIVGMMQDDEDP